MKRSNGLLAVAAVSVLAAVGACSRGSGREAEPASSAARTAHGPGPAEQTPAPASAAGPARGNAVRSDRAATTQPDDARGFREVTLPAGTVLPLELRSAVASDSSHVEDTVRATLRRALTVDGVEALPAGTEVIGHVTAANRSARVKGRAYVAFRFTSLDPPGAGSRVPISTETISRRAPATKRQDAAKIGGGAAGGAIVGGILGGGGGAAKGAAIGGAAGTGVVLSTRGKEVRLGPGAGIPARLAAPVTLRIATRG
jgi:hypothetical protein